MPSPPKPRPVALRIELQEVTPLVWRRVLVPNQWTLASLHHYLQWVMGWTDSHAHEFVIGENVVAPEWWIREISGDDDAREYRDERRVSVAALVAELGTRGEFEYHYDMGDGWEWSNAEDYPGYVKYTMEAYQMGINEIVYALTH